MQKVRKRKARVQQNVTQGSNSIAIKLNNIMAALQSSCSSVSKLQVWKCTVIITTVDFSTYRLA